MQLKDRIQSLVALGQALAQPSAELEAVLQQTQVHNQWFTIENSKQALEGIRQEFLQENLLQDWVKKYALNDSMAPQKVALILAGNIPLVGFHDVLCVFVAGHQAQIKLSDKDKFLLPFLVKLMARENPEVTDYFNFVSKLEDYDAVIATGSNNSARYFESYFSKVPHIIRKNRNAVAVLNGKESPDELAKLAKDVFAYFGLGCRNVSKLYLPRNYDFKPLLEAFHEFRHLVLHNKYKNNFDYNYTLLILNKISYEANGCILLTEEESLQSRIACLHYEYYDNLEKLAETLDQQKEEIQCVVSTDELSNWSVIPPGKAQSPGLKDYADGVDTMQFLLSLG